MRNGVFIGLTSTVIRRLAESYLEFKELSCLWVEQMLSAQSISST
jgi:hypothetical protein